MSRKAGCASATDFALEQWFAEVKLADLSPDYDFVSLRLGSQPFTSDFRGFIFDDTNRGVRLFGTRASNQDQFNVVYFDQQEKNTDSDLNTFNDRGQQVLIANYYRQDFIWPGYTTQFSFHYDHDDRDAFTTTTTDSWCAPTRPASPSRTRSTLVISAGPAMGISARSTSTTLSIGPSATIS